MSHTFFLKEVLGLRRRGIAIDVASINHPDRPRAALPEIEREEADFTFYVKEGNKIVKALLLIQIALRHPSAAVRGLRAAFGLGGFDLRERSLALFYLAEALLVGEWMHRRSLGHLHVHFGGPVATVGLLVAAAWKIPWSLTIHGPDEFFDQERFSLRAKFNSAQFLFCISDFARSQVLRVAPELDPSRVEVIRLGVQLDEEGLLGQPTLKRERNADGYDPRNPVQIVCTGRLVAAKGHRVLIQALTQLKSDGIYAHTLLIGEGPERLALEEQSLRAGLGGQLEFAGARNHAETLSRVAEADIFVLASFAEGLPVALMEAMAVGVVCVSTCINGIPELISSGENGLLAAAGNAGELHAALRRLIRDPVLRQTMGEAARRTVQRSYDLSRNQAVLADALRRRILGDHPS